MPVPASTSVPTGPLDDAQQRELTAANERAKKIRRAAGVAAFNGWATALVAMVALPFALFDFGSLCVRARFGGNRLQ